MRNHTLQFILLTLFFLNLTGCSFLFEKNLDALPEGGKRLEMVSGRLGEAIVRTDLGETQIEIPDSLVEAVATRIDKQQKGDGTLITSISFGPGTDPVQVTLPEPELIDRIAPTAAQWQQISPLATAQEEVDPPTETTYPLQHAWQLKKAYFWKTHGGFGIGNRISTEFSFEPTDEKSITVTLQEAAGLFSNCATDDVLCFRGKDPVLFIHGYAPSVEGLGGGENTWKNFPARLLELETRKVKDQIESKYVAFEFRWVTATRFEEAAADLAWAIEEIAAKTGKTVHIVAHSLGGILVRTYLQGFAAHAPYQGHIASITTVGTPHSGLSKEDRVMHDVLFSRGQDTQGLLSGQLQIDFCQQISCYQMGQYVDFSDNALKVFKLNVDDNFVQSHPFLMDVPDDLVPLDRPGKFISLLSDLKTYPLPKKLPLQILIGLTTKQFTTTTQTLTQIQEGDALISFAGQRLIPHLLLDNAAPELLKASQRYGGIVTEYILGFELAQRPGHQSHLPLEHPDYWGYRHSGAPVGTLLNAKPVVQVTCETVDTCDHATFKKVKAWLMHYPSTRATIKTATTSAQVKVVTAEKNQPIPFAFVRIYRRLSVQERQRYDVDPLVGLIQTNKIGIATTDFAFEPNMSYYLHVNAWGFEAAMPTNPLKTDRTAAALDFGLVALAPKADRHQLSGTITDGVNPLSQVDYIVHNNNRWWRGQSDEQGYYAITGLVADEETDLVFFKPTYQAEKITLDNEALTQKPILNIRLTAAAQAAAKKMSLY